ncbi:MAG: cell division inhibitor SulA [Colwellia sp.]|jgi:cell division inhibitor SulA
MNLLNHFNTNALPIKNKSLAIEKPNWCDVRVIANTVEVSQQYTDIFQKHDLDNKWILMINPEEKPLQQLSIQGKIDPKKILKVNIHQRNISLKTIKNALEKGHCSAVILCNATLDKSQLTQLAQFAEKGQTKCIILTKQTQKRLNQNRLANYVTISDSSLLLH